MPPVRINVEKGHESCPASRPWAVVGAETGKVHGCHPTKTQARRQQSAIYAAVGRRGGGTMTQVLEEPTTAPAEAETETRWHGILGIEGAPTSDKRFLIPGEISQRDLPLPLRVQLQSGEGHDGAPNVGRIETISHIPASKFLQEGFDLPEELPLGASVIWASGVLNGEHVDTAEQMLENGAGVSLDIARERTALVDPESFEEVDPATVDPFDVLEGKYLQGIAGKAAAATIVDIPAIEGARLALIATGAIEMFGQIRIVRESLTASAAGLAPLKPPKDWFYRPEASEPTPLTVTAEGAVYGHLALFGQCHTSSARCELAPKSSSGYAFFHTGQLETDDGEVINVGRITVGDEGNAKGGHADLVLGTKGAMEHYDKTGCVGAFVRALDGRHGIWLSGAIRSDAPAERVRDMQANPPSGDWRPERNGLELVAALSVPVGGFPIPRYEARLVASAGGEEEVEALIMQGYVEEAEMEASKTEIRRKAVLEQARAELEWERDGFAYSAEERRRMARNGQALPDGSFPIANCSDAENAIHAQGRAGNQARAVAHIRKRVRAMGCSGDIFDPYK